MIILDTNVISEAVASQPDIRVKGWFGSQTIADLYTTATSVAEISFGIEKMPEGRRKNTLRDNMQIFFEVYFSGRVLPFDEAAARAYGRIVTSARAKGRAILMADGQIGSVAQTNGFTVATRDTAPFEAAGIPVINPWNVA